MPEFLQSNFNGEWSPLMLGRVELSRYATSLRTMENFAPTIPGGARKRPGTEYIGEVQDSSKKTRLESFTFSNEQSYLLEFSDLKLRFWRNGVLLSDTETTPYTEDEVFSLRMTSTNDIVYIASPNHAPYKLTRTSDTTFDFALLEFKNQPFEDQNLTTTTITPSGTTSSVTLTSSAPLFVSEMVGSSFEITHLKAREVYETTADRTNNSPVGWNSTSSYSQGTIILDQTGGALDYYLCISAYNGQNNPSNDPIGNYPSNFEAGIIAKDKNNNPIIHYVTGAWSLRTEGDWNNEWVLQESYDNQSTWITRHSLVSDNGSDNYTREGDETGNPVWFRLVLVSGNSERDPFTFTIAETEISGEVLINSVNTGNNTATATVVATKPLFSTDATSLWAENEWNPRKKYPKQVFFKNNRLCFASTKADNQAVWGSEVDKWDNFKRGIQEDSQPFKDVLRTGNQDPIQWVSEQSKTLLGLSSQIRNLTGEDGSSILAPGKNSSARQAGRGAADLEPVEVDDFTFYVQLGGRIIRGLTNDYERGVYAAADMTREAEHVTRGGVKQMAFQLNRVSTLYAVTGEGIAACLVFDPEVEKMGWYRLKTQGGTIESVAILPATGEEDEVYFVVKRSINGSTKRYIERLKNDQIRIQDDGLQDDMFYVDCGATITGTNISTNSTTNVTTIAGSTRLEGKEIQILLDGDYFGKKTVSSGSVTIPTITNDDFNNASSYKVGDRVRFLSGGTYTYFVCVLAYTGGDSTSTYPPLAVDSNSNPYFVTSKAICGLPIEAKLWPMPLEGITASGTTSGDKKRVKEITIDVMNSLGIQTKDSPDDTKEPTDLTPRQSDADLGSSPALYTGKLEVRNTLPRSFDGNVFYQSDIPFGVFIRNIITKWEKTS